MKKAFLLASLIALVMIPLTSMATPVHPKEQQRALKALTSNYLVRATFNSVAKETGIPQSFCTIALLRFAGNMTSGSIYIRYICTDLNISTGISSDIEASIYDGKTFVESIRIIRPG